MGKITEQPKKGVKNPEVKKGISKMSGKSNIFIKSTKESKESLPVQDLREEIASMNSQKSIINKVFENFDHPSRPISPSSRRQVGRRKRTSSISFSEKATEESSAPVTNNEDLDIWNKTQVFFDAVEDVSKLDDLFRIPSAPSNESLKKIGDWRSLMQKYVESSRRNICVCDIENIPLRKSQNEEISSFWKQNILCFQSDVSIKRNKTKLHTLISSLVEEDFRSPHPSENLSRKQLSLLPEVDEYQITYSSIPFEERLEAELSAAGMSIIDDTESDNEEQGFITDISVLKSHVDTMRPIVEDFHNDLKILLPDIRSKEDKFHKYLRDYKVLSSLLKKSPNKRSVQ